MIRIVDLCKNYGSLKVLKKINLTIENGKIYGFLGQNGAGKSTTMNIVTGLISYNSGEIYYDDLELNTNKRKILKKVGYLPQSPVFYAYMNADEYLNFIGSIGDMPKKLICERSDELLSLVNLKEARKRKIGGYSGGMKQRLGIAVALFNHPNYLFLDEPTSALDPEGRMEVLELIGKLKDSGITVLMSTHILNDVERTCDMVSIIDEGQIVVSETLDGLKNKYIEPVFDIEFNNLPENIHMIKNLDGVKDIQVNGSKLSVYVKEINQTGKNILQFLTKNEYSILSYNLRKSSLDDIFIRLVNKDGNI